MASPSRSSLLGGSDAGPWIVALPIAAALHLSLALVLAELRISPPAPVHQTRISVTSVETAASEAPEPLRSTTLEQTPALPSPETTAQVGPPPAAEIRPPETAVTEPLAESTESRPAETIPIIEPVAAAPPLELAPMTAAASPAVQPGISTPALEAPSIERTADRIMPMSVTAGPVASPLALPPGLAAPLPPIGGEDVKPAPISPADPAPTADSAPAIAAEPGLSLERPVAEAGRTEPPPPAVLRQEPDLPVSAPPAEASQSPPPAPLPGAAPELDQASPSLGTSPMVSPALAETETPPASPDAVVEPSAPDAAVAAPISLAQRATVLATPLSGGPPVLAPTVGPTADSEPTPLTTPTTPEASQGTLTAQPAQATTSELSAATPQSPTPPATTTGIAPPVEQLATVAGSEPTSPIATVAPTHDATPLDDRQAAPVLSQPAGGQATVVPPPATGLAAPQDRAGAQASPVGASGSGTPLAAPPGTTNLAPAPSVAAQSTAGGSDQSSTSVGIPETPTSAVSTTAPAVTSPVAPVLPAPSGTVVSPGAPGAATESTGEAPTTTQPAAPVLAPLPVRPSIAAVSSYISNYDGGECFLAVPAQSADGEVSIAVYASGEKAGSTFADRFMNAFAVRPAVSESRVSQTQCSALAFVRNSQGYPNSNVTLSIANSTIESGGQMDGAVSGSSNATIHLFIVDNDGLVSDADDHRQISSGETRFSIPVYLTEEEPETAQLLVAVSVPNSAVLPMLDGRVGGKAAEFFASLRHELISNRVNARFAVAPFAVVRTPAQ